MSGKLDRDTGGLVSTTLTAEADRLEEEAHGLIARGHELLAKAAGLRALRRPGGVAGPSDNELVPLTEVPLDARTRRRLEREGRLPFEKHGRRKFTTRAALAALVAPRAGGDAPEMSAPEPTTNPRDPREAARLHYAEPPGSSRPRPR
jgi:hypothetical protein